MNKRNWFLDALSDGIADGINFALYVLFRLIGVDMVVGLIVLIIWVGMKILK